MPLRPSLPILGACALILLALTGCPNPNTYGTPRTVPPGKVMIIAAAEGVGVTVREPNGTGGTSSTSFYAPTLPTGGVRIGLADRMDLGLRLSQLSSFQADFKYNFLKSPVFDMAIDPGAQLGYFGIGGVGAGLFYFNVPLILAVNFSHMASLVVTPGFTYLVVTANDDTASGSAAFATGSAPLARLGIGFNLRVAKTIALQPEVTALKAFDSSEVLYWNFGFGVLIGTSGTAMPDYSDVN